MSQTANQKAKRIPLGKDASTKRRLSKTRRHFRLRKKVSGTPERPRLVVNRSSRHIHVQLVDDLAATPWPPRRPSKQTCAWQKATRRLRARRSVS
ncbi:hypothetical protein GCM10020255_064970 [Rhodococcus baikonurensis]